MFIRKLTLTALMIAGIAGMATTTVEARPPDGARPSSDCKYSYVSSETKKALKLDKAKQRARGSWEFHARMKYGRGFNDWRKAQYRQYGCSKNGKHHYCVAEAFACPMAKEAG